MSQEPQEKPTLHLCSWSSPCASVPLKRGRGHGAGCEVSPCSPGAQTAPACKAATADRGEGGGGGRTQPGSEQSPGPALILGPKGQERSSMCFPGPFGESVSAEVEAPRQKSPRILKLVSLLMETHSEHLHEDQDKARRPLCMAVTPS